MLVIVAVALSVLMAFGALAIDASALYLENARLQTALDAGVLAGASMLPDTEAARREAEYYIEQNGVSKGDVSITFENGNMVITATGREEIPAGFSAVMGKETNGVSAGASAEKYFANNLWPYDYLLFSGDPDYTFTMGGNFDIGGSIHSNGSLYASPGWGMIAGAAEACKDVYINKWTMTAGTTVPGAPFVEMPDFTGVEAATRPRKPSLPARPETYKNLGSGNLPWDASQTFPNYTVMAGSTTINCSEAAINNTMHCMGSLNITGKAVLNGGTLYVDGNLTVGNRAAFNGNVYVNGDLVISGGAPVCTLNGNLYVMGNIRFGGSYAGTGTLYSGKDITFSGGSVTHDGTVFAEGKLDMGNSFTGTGNVFAGGDITFNGGGMQMRQTDNVCVYSKNGNIYMVTGDTRVSGVVYAPKGSVKLNGNHTQFFGSIIAYRLTGIPANLVARAPDEPPEIFGPNEPKIRLIR